MSPPGSVLSDQQVDIIAMRLAERLSGSSTAKLKSTASVNAPAIASDKTLGEGVFATVDDAVSAAGIAFNELDGMSLDGQKKSSRLSVSQCSHMPRSLHVTHTTKQAWADLSIR